MTQGDVEKLAIEIHLSSLDYCNGGNCKNNYTQEGIEIARWHLKKTKFLVEALESAREFFVSRKGTSGIVEVNSIEDRVYNKILKALEPYKENGK